QRGQSSVVPVCGMKGRVSKPTKEILVGRAEQRRQRGIALAQGRPTLDHDVECAEPEAQVHLGAEALLEGSDLARLQRVVHKAALAPKRAAVPGVELVRPQELAIEG